MTNYDKLHQWFQHLVSLTPEQLACEPFIWQMYGGDSVGSDTTTNSILEWLNTDDAKDFEDEFHMTPEEFWRDYHKADREGSYDSFWKHVKERKQMQYYVNR